MRGRQFLLDITLISVWSFWNFYLLQNTLFFFSKKKWVGVVRKLLNQTILLIYLIKRQKLYSLRNNHSAIVRLSRWVENHSWEKKFAVRLSNWPPEWAFIREMANVSHLSSPVGPSRIDSNENYEKSYISADLFRLISISASSSQKASRIKSLDHSLSLWRLSWLFDSNPPRDKVTDCAVLGLEIEDRVPISQILPTVMLGDAASGSRGTWLGSHLTSNRANKGWINLDASSTSGAGKS